MTLKYQMNVLGISDFLNMSDQGTELRGVLEKFYDSSEDQEKASQIILEFVNLFGQFKDVEYMIHEVTETIFESVPVGTLAGLDRSLLKNIVVRMIQIYINNTPFSDKETLLGTLTKSLQNLFPGTLIYMLGTFVRPIMTNPVYLAKMEELKQSQQVEVLGSEKAQIIRNHVDKWLLAQNLDPDKQKMFQKMLLQEVSAQAIKLNLSPDSEEFKEIVLESNEMLTMQLTAISLLNEIDEI